jgi:uncharacterized membrane protein (DUF4010 family)
VAQIVNQHSFVAVVLALVALMLLFTRHRSRRLRRIAILAAVSLLAGWFVTHRTGTGDVRPAADVDRALRGGLPVAVEFYSNY